MATLQELVKYVERGFTIQNVRGESLRMQDTWVEWRHHSHWGSGFDAEKMSRGQVASLEDIWEWGVVFCDQAGKNLFVETDVRKIEELIARGVPGASYGGVQT
jgi:hypothetical protein